jgi:hypothetical protein
MGCGRRTLRMKGDFDDRFFLLQKMIPFFAALKMWLVQNGLLFWWNLQRKTLPVCFSRTPLHGFSRQGDDYDTFLMTRSAISKAHRLGLDHQGRVRTSHDARDSYPLVARSSGTQDVAGPPVRHDDGEVPLFYAIGTTHGDCWCLSYIFFPKINNNKRQRNHLDNGTTTAHWSRFAFCIQAPYLSRPSSLWLFGAPTGPYDFRRCLGLVAGSINLYEQSHTTRRQFREDRYYIHRQRGKSKKWRSVLARYFLSIVQPS